LAPSGDDVDDTAEGIGPVERTLGTAKDFDAVHVGEEEMGQVGGPGRVDGVVELDAVQEDKGVFGIGAPEKHRGGSAHSSVLGNRNGRGISQCLEHKCFFVAAEVEPGDHGNGAPDLPGRGFEARGRDDDLVLFG
jgi:hypothetical protein